MADINDVNFDKMESGMNARNDPRISPLIHRDGALTIRVEGSDQGYGISVLYDYPGYEDGMLIEYNWVSSGYENARQIAEEIFNLRILEADARYPAKINPLDYILEYKRNLRLMLNARRMMEERGGEL